MLKIDRNHNIMVVTRKVEWVSCLPSRSISISLPSVQGIPEVSVITKEES